MRKLDLHPATVKSLKKGHPWITRDQFSAKFPVHQKLLTVFDPKSEDLLGVFIHDPAHPKVVARLWSDVEGDFTKQLKDKIVKAHKRRKEQTFNRENIYLAFGEADGLPGLFVQKLGSTLLIQYHCFVWEKWMDLIINQYKAMKIDIDAIWTQKRIPGEGKTPPVPVKKSQESEQVIQEDQIKFKVCYDQYHDIGLYTDMSSLREQFDPYFAKAGTVLNLFSYTGAFSLMALKHGAKVCSSDLSRKYMEWLEENIKLNEFNEDQHESLVGPCDKTLTKLVKQERNFDLIISDPPSFSSDKKKRKSAKDFYKENLDNICNLLAPGGRAILFMNTHQLSKRQFKELIQGPVKKHKNIQLESEHKMSLDCPTLPSFPEGNYLKCLVIRAKPVASQSDFD